MFMLLHVLYHTYLFFVVEIQNMDSKSKKSGLFCATLYIPTRNVVRVEISKLSCFILVTTSNVVVQKSL